MDGLDLAEKSTSMTMSCTIYRQVELRDEDKTLVAVKPRNLLLRTSTSHSRERNREVRRAASTDSDYTQKYTHIEHSRRSSKESRARCERGHSPHRRSNIETSRQSSKERRAASSERRHSYEGSYIEHSLYQRSVQLAHGPRRSSQGRRAASTTERDYRQGRSHNEPSRRSNEQGLGFEDVHRFFVETTMCDPHHRPNQP